MLHNRVFSKAGRKLFFIRLWTFYYFLCQFNRYLWNHIQTFLQLYSRRLPTYLLRLKIVYGNYAPSQAPPLSVYRRSFDVNCVARGNRPFVSDCFRLNCVIYGFPIKRSAAQSGSVVRDIFLWSETLTLNGLQMYQHFSCQHDWRQ